MTINTIKARITKRSTQADKVVVIELSPSESKQCFPAFEAGAHIDIHVDNELIRQYSLCGKPSDTNVYRIGVLNDPQSRGGSKKIFADFKTGDEITISEPRNHFPVEASAAHTILIGGGIGITPLISMAYELRDKGKPFSIHYCIKSKDQAGFVEELSAEFKEQTTFHCSADGQDKKFSAKNDLPTASSDTHIYICGPNSFMESLIDEVKSLGYPSSNVHFEFFQADVDTSGSEIEVYCEDSDITVTVNEDESIATALMRAGVRVSLACEEGVCGTCITDVIEGEPDHRDLFLTDEEKEDNDQIIICCSRSKSARLVLDI